MSGSELTPASGPPGPHIRTVDGLRGLAALLVVFDHTVDEDWGLGAWTAQNHGITAFALLTGFLLSGQFLRRRLDGKAAPATGAFLRARAARVYPGYWVALAGAAAWIGLENMGTGDWWRVLTLTQSFDTDTPFEGLPTAWSLSLFLSFYLALPLWSRWRGRSDRAGRSDASVLRSEVAWLLGLVALAWLVRTFTLTGSIGQEPIFTLLGRADWFAIGMIIAALVIAQARGLAPRALLLPGRHPSLALLLVLALTTAAALVPMHLTELRDQLDTAAGALLVAAAVLHGPVLRGPQRVLASKPARALGRWSYGIFLWGYIVQVAVTQVVPGIATGPHLAASFVGAIALGAASWRWVEKPASERLRGARRRREATPSGASARRATAPA